MAEVTHIPIIIAISALFYKYLKREVELCVFEIIIFSPAKNELNNNISAKAAKI